MNADADASQLLEQAALPRRGPLLDDAAEYLRRTRLGRRCGLIAARLTRARLARRPRPADDPERARLDDLLRGMSARAAAGGAAALALASGISEAVYVVGARAVVCPARPGNPVPAYPLAASL